MKTFTVTMTSDMLTALNSFANYADMGIEDMIKYGDVEEGELDDMLDKVGEFFRLAIRAESDA